MDWCRASFLSEVAGVLLRGMFQGISGFPRPGLARIFTDGSRIPGVRFAKTRVFAQEAQGSVEATVLRYGDSHDALAVDCRVMTRNSAGENETSGRASIVFSPGETDATISISITDNEYAEEDREIELRLEDPASRESHCRRPAH